MRFLLARDGLPAGFSQVEGLFRHTSFQDFLSHFGKATSLLRRPEDPAWLLKRLLSRQKRQGVVYTEVRISPSVWERHGLPREAAMRHLLDLAGRGAVEHRLIVDAVRQWGKEALERDLDLCLAHRKSGIVALGLGGDEREAPAALFRDLAAECRAKGLPVVPHAGEALGPEEVLRAVETFGARRIGHGIAAAREAALTSLLRGLGVHLEVCPTSNRRTGVVPRGRKHPFPDLWRSGVSLSLSTDDPGLFKTTLGREISWAKRAARLGDGDLVALQVQAARSSFLSRRESEALVKRVGG